MPSASIDALLSQLAASPVLASRAVSARPVRGASTLLPPPSVASLSEQFQREPRMRVQLATLQQSWPHALRRDAFVRGVGAALGAPLAPLGAVFDAVDSSSSTTHRGTGVVSAARLSAGLITLLGLDAADAASAIAARSPDPERVSSAYFEEAFAAAVAVGLLVSTKERGESAAHRARRTAAVHARALRAREQRTPAPAAARTPGAACAPGDAARGLTKREFNAWFVDTVHSIAVQRLAPARAAAGALSPAQRAAHKVAREDAALLQRRAEQGGVDAERFEAMRESTARAAVQTERDVRLGAVDGMLERLRIMLRSAT
jgi:hypothetical protein